MRAKTGRDGAKPLPRFGRRRKWSNYRSAPKRPCKGNETQPTQSGGQAPVVKRQSARLDIHFASTIPTSQAETGGTSSKRSVDEKTNASGKQNRRCRSGQTCSVHAGDADDETMPAMRNEVMKLREAVAGPTAKARHFIYGKTAGPWLMAGDGGATGKR